MRTRTPLIPAWEASCTISWQGIHLHFFHVTKLGCHWADRLTCYMKFQDIVAARLWHVFWTLLARFTITKIRPKRLENHAMQGYGGLYLYLKEGPGDWVKISSVSLPESSAWSCKVETSATIETQGCWWCWNVENVGISDNEACQIRRETVWAPASSRGGLPKLFDAYIMTPHISNAGQGATACSACLVWVFLWLHSSFLWPQSFLLW